MRGRRSSRGSTAGTRPGGRALPRRTRPCGRRRCRARAHRGLRDQRASMKASCELPVANMAWATPRASTAARMMAAAWSAAARAMAATSGWTSTWAWSYATAGRRTVMRSACQWSSARLEPMREVAPPRPGAVRRRLGRGAPVPCGHPGGARTPARSGHVRSSSRRCNRPVRSRCEAAWRRWRRRWRQIPPAPSSASSAGNHGLGLAYAASKLQGRRSRSSCRAMRRRPRSRPSSSSTCGWSCTARGTARPRRTRWIWRSGKGAATSRPTTIPT